MGRDELVNRMMELYAVDVIAEVPPHDEDQIGPVMLEFCCTAIEFGHVNHNCASRNRFA